MTNTEHSVEIDADECERCEGSGDRYGRMAYRVANPVPCPDCNGTGSVIPPEASER